MIDIRHRSVTANGIRRHIAESGPSGGPCIVLCHGFPESWYSWRCGHWTQQERPDETSRSMLGFLKDVTGDGRTGR